MLQHWQPFPFLTAGLLEAEDPREAIEGFNQVVKMEGDKGEW